MDAEPLAPVTSEGDAGMKIDYNEDSMASGTDNMAADTDMKDDNDIETAAVVDNETVMRDDYEDAAAASGADESADAQLNTTSTTLTDGGMAVEDQPGSSGAGHGPDTSTDFAAESEPSLSSAPPSLAIDLPPSSLVTAPALLGHAGFTSPPLITVSADSRQTSLLGHSAAAQPPFDGSQRHSPVITPSPEARYHTGDASDTNGNAPAASGTTDAGTTSSSAMIPQPGSDLSNPSLPLQTQARDDLDLGKALATQHQHTDDDKMSQEQTVENKGERKTTVTQRQSLEPDDESPGQVPARQENEVTIRQQSPDHENGDGEWHTIVETNQRNQGGDVASHGGQIQQINHVKVFRRGHDSAANGLSGGLLARPNISKHMLNCVDIGSSGPGVSSDLPREDADDTGSSDDRLVPLPVILEYSDKQVSLFGSIEGESWQVLFEDSNDHELYFDQIECLLERLRKELPDLSSKDEELELDFTGLGIVLAEDSVYTRETCLYDFDRMHVGCNLEGRLRIRVTASRGRFARDFNALASHVAQLYQTGGVGSVVPFDESGSAHGQTEDDEQDYEVEEEYVEVVGVDNQQDDEADPDADVDDVVVEDEDDQGDANAESWHDEDVEYAQDETIEPDGDERVGEDQLDDEAGEFEDDNADQAPENLDEALAELDNDDLTAYIEGAQEDFVLSELQREEEASDAAVPQVSLKGDADIPSESVELSNKQPPKENVQVDKAANLPTDDTTSDVAASGYATEISSGAQASNGLKVPLQLELSYDTPVSTGNEPPAVPVDKLDAVVDAVAASENIAATDIVSGVPQSAVAEDAMAASANSAANGDNVVAIDYGDSESYGVGDASNGSLSGEKRARIVEDGAGADDQLDNAVTADAKRVKLDEGPQ
ncbi:hypothetical protein OIO90_005646 [Microbotryomycetes sp. JL221]|nr:hypothetical protein OIO90_005646 [Microbotryomycetes sp. JL221]